TSASACSSFCAAPTPANPPPRIRTRGRPLLGIVTSSSCKSWLDSPRARGRLAGLETDERVAGPEGVRWTRHGLDGEAAPGDVWQRIAREHHEVGVALVYPEGDAVARLRVVEQHPRAAVGVAREARE